MLRSLHSTKSRVFLLVIALLVCGGLFLCSCSSDSNASKSGEHTASTEPMSDSSGLSPLHVEGTGLVNAQGEKIQLKGVSTHGIAWFPEYVNAEAFQTLKDDWGANVMRIAVYTDEYGGWCNGGDRELLRKTIDDGVQAATDAGQYVIIDWHILHDNNPNMHKKEALEFFAEMAERYADYPNVIYEICNEPQQSPWASTIKPYAEEVIATIREYAPHAVILVGTNTWSQDVDEVVGNQIDDPNVMYVLHFYAGTHKENIQNKLKTALDAGVPIFVSECSITDASGNGAIDYASADTWLKLLNDNGISFIAWSLSNKNESSALISPSCDKTSGWTDNDLSDAGKWFKKAISE